MPHLKVRVGDAESIEGSSGRNEPQWYAIRTRARAEKKVAALLKQGGFQGYCPLVSRERQWADRKKQVAFPLFPGYVFASFALSAVSDVLRTPGVVTIVRNEGRPTPVREDELRSVRRLEEGIAESGIEPGPAEWLEVGEEVVVTAGPFAGMRGVLLERRRNVRVAVRLTAIRQAIAIDVDHTVVRAIE